VTLARVIEELRPLAARPILDPMLDRPVRPGVDEVVMSSPYLEEAFAPFITSRAGAPRITWITAPAPLGTGGAIVHALPALGAEPFFALNGDSLREADLGELVAFHRSTGAKATILLTPVADPSRYGLVRTAADGRVVPGGSHCRRCAFIVPCDPLPPVSLRLPSVVGS